MESLSLVEIASMCGATCASGSPGATVRRISKDTRTLIAGDLYFALKGDNFDGNRFAAQAVEKGAAAVVLDDPSAADTLPEGFPVLMVPDGLEALQRLAASWRDRLRAHVVCITGSNGKTSTKDFTAAVLGVRFRTTKTSGNLNNSVGLPLSILSASVTDSAAVWEIGMNHPGEIAPLAALARPSVGIVTNIGVAHIENLSSREAIAREKSELLRALPENGSAIFPDTDDFASLLGSASQATVVRTGGPRSRIRAEDIKVSLDKTGFTLLVEDQKLRAFLPVPGSHMVANALLAVAAGLACGLTAAECVEGLSEATMTSGRLERRSVRGVVFLDDSYNANPDSMIAALEVLSRLPAKGKKIAVLGRMGELGDFAEEGYKRVGSMASSFVDLLIATGPETSPMADAAGSVEVVAVQDTREACAVLKKSASPGDIILVKGSRAARMETIIENF